MAANLVKKTPPPQLDKAPSHCQLPSCPFHFLSICNSVCRKKYSIQQRGSLHFRSLIPMSYVHPMLDQSWRSWNCEHNSELAYCTEKKAAHTSNITMFSALHATAGERSLSRWFGYSTWPDIGTASQDRGNNWWSVCWPSQHFFPEEKHTLGDQNWFCQPRSAFSHAEWSLSHSSMCVLIMVFSSDGWSSLWQYGRWYKVDWTKGAFRRVQKPSTRCWATAT